MELKFSAVILQNKDMDAAYVEVPCGIKADRESCVAISRAALEKLLQSKQNRIMLDLSKFIFKTFRGFY